MPRETPSLTSLPDAPGEERLGRMVSYSIAMAARIVCLFLCFVVPGWWKLIPVAGVIILPAIAVMTANIVHQGDRAKASRHTAHHAAIPGPKT